MTGIPLGDVQYAPPSAAELDRDAVVAEALMRLGVVPDLMPRFTDATHQIVQYESAWDAGACARICAHGGRRLPDGQPEMAERSLMQLRPRDFARFYLPGTAKNVYDPVASIVAGWRFLSYWFGVNLQTGDGLDDFMTRFQANPGKRYGQPESAETVR